MFPLAAPAPVETVTLVVPCPAVIVHPAGTVQVYVVAFGTAAILYVKLVLLMHWTLIPVIEPGVTGAGGLTVIVTSLLVAVAGLTQAAFEVITTVTLSPLTSVVEL
jgi:hypothetical protein